MSQILNNRYRILQTLGSGGFGDTFLAEDSQMPSRRRCVIKQLRPITTNSQIQKLVEERFAREAAILEELGENNNQIPKLYAYFNENNRFYLVQEWIEGNTLTKLVEEQGIVGESFVQEFLIKILPILSFIHGKGIVHRDIKPDNIILRGGDNKPVLIDFGAVKETMGTMLNSQGKTANSIVIGTPGFMPSEQAAGRPVYSSDLYALGLVCVYLLTGKIPQDLDSDPRTGEISLRENLPNLNSNLATVLEHSILSHHRERYTSAQEMLDALENHSVDLQDRPTQLISSPRTTTTETVVNNGDNQNINKSRNHILLIGFGAIILVIVTFWTTKIFLTNRLKNPETNVNMNSSPPINNSRQASPNPNILSPKITTERVKFAPGSISTQLTGNISKGEIKRFILAVAAGQQFTAKILPGDYNLSVISPEKEELAVISRINNRWQGILPSTGDYLVEVIANNDSEYDISLEILPKNNTSKKQQVSIERLTFNPGENGKTVRGKVSETRKKKYLLRCLQGQNFSWQIIEGNINLTIVAPNGRIIGQRINEDNNWEGTLPSNGDYVIEISASSDTEYEGRVEVY